MPGCRGDRRGGQGGEFGWPSLRGVCRCGRADAVGGCRGEQGHRRPWRGSDPGRHGEGWQGRRGRARADHLQHGLAGHGRLGHRSWCHQVAARPWAPRARLRAGDAALQPGGAAHRVRARRGQPSGHPRLRLHGCGADAAPRRGRLRRGRRPRRRQRGHGQQDRHLWPERPGEAPRRALLRGGADHLARAEDKDGRGDPDRGTARGRALLPDVQWRDLPLAAPGHRRLESGLRRHACRPDRRPCHGARLDSEG
mmetsp:Transcript_52826/g.146413  ORF Transcript_52826/g.146413 Transcript_52826/m.146413 type:complete len:253 (+) Transcript_52826:421-1179(+)